MAERRICDWDGCPTLSTYYDAQGEGQSCGGHFMILAEPRYYDPVSTRMAREMREMLTDPDEAPEIEEE